MSDGLQYAAGIFGLAVNEEINWETDKIVSYSQYSMYNKCPKSWELRYVRKHKVASQSIHFVYGTAMHEVIQKYLHVCYTESIKAADALDLRQLLLEALKKEYAAAIEQSGEHFSSKEQLSEFYSDGCMILNYIKKKRTSYFKSKNVKLIGIELPILVSPDEDRPNIKLQQYLDLVFYDESEKRYRIVDIKTAKNGWNQYKRKDKFVTNQLVLYKQHFCDKFSIDPDIVDIEYFILRQKIDPDSLWPIKRVSSFSPSSGKVSLKRVSKSFQEFLDACFDKNGQYKDISHPALTGERGWNCTYCDYRDLEHLCPPDKRI